MAIEIVDLAIKHGDFPWLCKRLPAGNIEKHINHYNIKGNIKWWLIVG